MTPGWRRSALHSPGAHRGWFEHLPEDHPAHGFETESPPVAQEPLDEARPFSSWGRHELPPDLEEWEEP